MCDNPRQTASRLRRQLHEECARADLARVRRSLHDLYEVDDSPLGQSAAEVGTPAAFSALVEVACLATAHAALSPQDPNRAHMANELRSNVARLWRGFNVDGATMAQVRRALALCASSRTLDSAHAATSQALNGTQLHDRVKVVRHRVSYGPTPPQPGLCAPSSTA